ncbi:MAG: hypothetical protein LUQ65_13485 [Candidatus Helarchaeota archaeon]|nr:hypothetical protein [Candidatus Helarchaeota archaeon]
MIDSISPSNITGAAFIAQFTIIGIIFVGAFILYKQEESEPFHIGRSQFSRHVWKILAVALITIGCLLFSLDIDRHHFL